MRLPFLKSKSVAGGAARPAPGAEDPGALQTARIKARRRLIGAVVLLAAAVAGFPLLFETQPRPLPGKAGAASPSLVIKSETAAPRAAAPEVPAVRSAPAEPGASAAVAVAAASPSMGASDRVAAAPAVVAPPAAAVVPAAPAPASAGAKPGAASDAPAEVTAVNANPGKSAPEKAAAAPAASAPAAKPAKAAATAVASSSAGEIAVRWVVQVGAYNDMERMRQARQKAEKLGFKTYITDVDTPTGKRTRVRLGPFATKKEAEAAAAKVKAAGMAANVLSM